MKARILIIPVMLGAIILGGCASGGYIADDVYYNPDQNQAGVQAQDQQQAVARQPAEASGEEAFSAIDDQYRKNTYNEDTLQLSPEEAEANQGGNVIINNYNDSYAARINRFYNPSLGFDYYDPLWYGSAYNPWYGPGLGFSLGLGMSFYPGGYYPMMSPFSSLYYGGYGGYGYGGYGYGGYGYGGYGYGGYGYGGGYYPYYRDYELNSNMKYGHRSSIASNRMYSSGTSATPQVKSSIIPSDSRRINGTGTRASGITQSSNQPRRTAAGNVSRNTGAGTVTKAAATSPVYRPRRVTQTGLRTTRLPESTTIRSEKRTTISTNTHRNISVPRSNRRVYVPRYSNNRTTGTMVRPSYNPSHRVGSSRSRSVTSSPIRKSYSPPVRRSSSSYSTPRRSYSAPRSYTTPSSTRVSAPRSSSSSSRSSGSGRRR